MTAAPLLEQLLGEVLQEAALVLADPAPPSATVRWGDAVVSATVAFHGAGHGALRLATSRRAAVELAAGMLGIASDEAEADDHARAAVAELANIAAGSLLVRLFGAESPGRLGIPETRVMDCAPEAIGASALLLLEGGDPVRLEVRVDG